MLSICSSRSIGSGTETLADVDAGLVIDHQTVQAWADGLVGDKVLPH